MKSLKEEQSKRREAERTADKVMGDIWAQLRREHLQHMADNNKLPNHPLPENLKGFLVTQSGGDTCDLML